MRDRPHRQAGCGIRFDWGAAGAHQLARDTPAGALVVIDVLSFSTAVTVAVERGTAVHPFRWNDDRVHRFAAERDAVVAVGRRAATASHPWSLSPRALREAPAAERLVLPSPNGSTIAAAATGLVLAAGLTNATAVAGWLVERGFGTVHRPVSVIAAGERWPDGAFRPALEDLLGAGALIRALLAGGIPDSLPSAEARAAAAAHAGTPDVPAAVRDCASGRELVLAGFGADVDVATELDASRLVPVLVDGAFVAS